MPRWIWAALAVVAVAALAFALEPHAYPSYDYAFALSAAQDILHGRTTGYDVAIYSPVPHPFTVLLALATVPLPGTTAIFTAVALLLFGLLCVAAFRTAQLVAGPAAGALAALIVFTAPKIFEPGVRTDGDVWFAALVVSALALELARARRGWPVLAVLALAGMLRPEAWVLAGLYWLYIFPGRPWRERVALGALAAAAPVAWCAMDLFLTGDPLHSIHHTATYTSNAHRILSPHSLSVEFRSLVGATILFGAAAGAVIALRTDLRRGALVVGTTLGILALTIGPAVLGQTPVLRRYLILPASLMAVLFAIACMGWVQQLRARRSAPAAAWAIGGVALVALATTLAIGTNRARWRGDRSVQQARAGALEHLRGWVDGQPQNTALRSPDCLPLRTPGYAFRPYLRLWLDTPPRQVLFDRQDFAPNAPTLLLPRAGLRDERAMLGDYGDRSRTAIVASPRFRAEYRRIAGDARWDLYADGACRRALARARATA